MSLAPGSQLGPYQIVSQLGSGGMGVVYEATDPRLKRTVAIKLLPPDLTRDDTAKQRFLQEAQAASALDHPNICTIYEINETEDGQLYLVMAHYEGETLMERISRGPLDLNDAIDIATQVGEGLAEAHRAGIVHRDIKPANLLVTKTGVVKILDFGLAKLAGAEGVTQTGTTVGTVAYMSPEQAKGQEVDHRTDIWSLGVVLYEMLAGTPPFQGENLLSLSNAITGGNASPLTGSSSSAHGAVTKALNKDRAQRYQAVPDLLTELRVLRSGSGAATVATSVPRDVPSIAVLPFTNMSADPEQEYFCDGMAEEIINALTKLENLRVVARTSAFQFKGQALDLREVGKQLDVATVLEGGVRKAGSRLRVTAQLINVSDGYHLWSERYDRNLDDVFAIQDDIAGRIVARLRATLGDGGGVSLVPPPTTNMEAYELYVKGRALWHKRGPATTQALEAFTNAVTLDPDYAVAWAGVADAHTSLGLYGGESAEEAMRYARHAANRAVDLDPSSAEAHAASGAVALYHEWDWHKAEQELCRALELNPGYAAARGWYACNYLVLVAGRLEEGLAHMRKALQLDPLSGNALEKYATVLGVMGHNDEAHGAARAAVERGPDSFLAHWLLQNTLRWLGRFEESVAAGEAGLDVTERHPMLLASMASTYAAWEKPSKARACHDELAERAAVAHVPPTVRAWAACAVGLRREAVALLQRAYGERDPLLTQLGRCWPDLAVLREDTRVQDLLRRMNLPPTGADALAGSSPRDD